MTNGEDKQKKHNFNNFVKISNQIIIKKAFPYFLDKILKINVTRNYNTAIKDIFNSYTQKKGKYNNLLRN